MERVRHTGVVGVGSDTLLSVAGCVAYRGYFRKALADREATRHRSMGHDVAIGEVPAYSTLGWFADPVLSSMLRWDDDELVGTIFHELAHQKLYVKDDSSFNESYASFVEKEGVREWRDTRHLSPPDGRDDALDLGFTKEVLALRDRLKAIYASPGPTRRSASPRPRSSKTSAGGISSGARPSPEATALRPMDGTAVEQRPLLPFGLYDGWTSSFAALFEQSGGPGPSFSRR